MERNQAALMLVEHFKYLGLQEHHAEALVESIQKGKIEPEDAYHLAKEVGGGSV